MPLDQLIVQDDEENLFFVAQEAARGAALRGITLFPRPGDGVRLKSPPGHYLWLTKSWAQIIAVDDYRSTGGDSEMYDDLLPGYEASRTEVLDVDDPANRGRFVSVYYRRA